MLAALEQQNILVTILVGQFPPDGSLPEPFRLGWALSFLELFIYFYLWETVSLPNCLFILVSLAYVGGRA